jgi:hypothetical protein
MQSAYERWTWARCREQILSLKGRLGFDQRLWVLGFELLDSGRLLDPFRRSDPIRKPDPIRQPDPIRKPDPIQGIEIFDPACAVPPTAIPSRYSAVPEIYCLLSTYAAATEPPLRGDAISLASLNPARRQELSADDCAALLSYARRDLPALQAVGVPFFSVPLPRGDLALQVWPLPRVPVSLVLWRGDEDLDDGGTLLFDSSASHYLPGLLAELAGLTVWRLRNIIDPAVKWGYHRLAAASASQKLEQPVK